MPPPKPHKNGAAANANPTIPTTASTTTTAAAQFPTSAWPVTKRVGSNRPPHPCMEAADGGKDVAAAPPAPPPAGQDGERQQQDDNTTTTPPSSPPSSAVPICPPSQLPRQLLRQQQERRRRALRRLRAEEEALLPAAAQMALRVRAERRRQAYHDEMTRRLDARRGRGSAARAAANANQEHQEQEASFSDFSEGDYVGPGHALPPLRPGEAGALDRSCGGGVRGPGRGTDADFLAATRGLPAEVVLEMQRARMAASDDAWTALIETHLRQQGGSARGTAGAGGGSAAAAAGAEGEDREYERRLVLLKDVVLAVPESVLDALPRARWVADGVEPEEMLPVAGPAAAADAPEGGADDAAPAAASSPSAKAEKLGKEQEGGAAPADSKTETDVVLMPTTDEQQKQSPTATKTTTTEARCSVCQDEYRPGDALLRLPCGHMDHEPCLRQYLSRYGKRCPVCKADVIDLVNEAAAGGGGGEEGSGNNARNAAAAGGEARPRRAEPVVLGETIDVSEVVATSQDAREAVQRVAAALGLPADALLESAMAAVAAAVEDDEGEEGGADADASLSPPRSPAAAAAADDAEGSSPSPPSPLSPNSWLAQVVAQGGLQTQPRDPYMAAMMAAAMSRGQPGHEETMALVSAAMARRARFGL
jgi:hypothetical protein